MVLHTTGRGAVRAALPHWQVATHLNGGEAWDTWPAGHARSYDSKSTASQASELVYQVCISDEGLLQSEHSDS